MIKPIKPINTGTHSHPFITTEILSRSDVIIRYAFFTLAYQGLSHLDHVYYASISLDVDQTISVEAKCSDMSASCPVCRSPDEGTLHHLNDLTFHTVIVKHYTDASDMAVRMEHFYDAAYNAKTWSLTF